MPNLPNHFQEHNRRAGGSWIVINPARRTRSGRRPGKNAIQTEDKPGTGGLWFNQYLYHSSPVPGLSI